MPPIIISLKERINALPKAVKNTVLIFLVFVLIIFAEASYYLCLGENILGCGLFVENFLPGIQKNEFNEIREMEVSRILEGELVSISKEGLTLRSEGEEIYVDLDKICFVLLLQEDKTTGNVEGEKNRLKGILKEVSQLESGQIVGVAQK